MDGVYLTSQDCLSSTALPIGTNVHHSSNHTSLSPKQWVLKMRYAAIYYSSTFYISCVMCTHNWQMRCCNHKRAEAVVLSLSSPAPCSLRWTPASPLIWGSLRNLNLHLPVGQGCLLIDCFAWSLQTWPVDQEGHIWDPTKTKGLMSAWHDMRNSVTSWLK